MCQAFFTFILSKKRGWKTGRFFKTARLCVEGVGNYMVAPASRGLFQASRLKPGTQKLKRQIFSSLVKSPMLADTMWRDATLNPPEAGATSSDQPAN